MVERGPAARYFIVVLCLVVATPSSAQVYIHNTGDEAAITEAQKGLVESKSTYLAAFDENAAALADLFKAERVAAVDADLARRDFQLARVLDTRAQNPETGRIVLLAAIEKRQKEIGGANWEAAGPAGGAGFIGARARAVANFRRQRADNIGTRDDLLTLFRQRGGKGSGCDDRGANRVDVPPEAPADSGEYYQSALDVCTLIANDTKFLEAFQSASTLPPALRAGLGDATAVASLNPGAMRAAVEQRDQLKALFAAQSALQKAAAAHLKDLEDYLACQTAKAAEPRIDDEIRKVAGQLNGFIDWLSALDADSGKDLAATPTQSAEPATEACKTESGQMIAAPATISSVAELADKAKKDEPGLPSWAEIRQVIAAAHTMEPNRSIAAALQEEAQEFKAGKLGDVLTALATIDVGTKPDGLRARIAVAIAQMLGHFDDLRPGNLPRISAVLVDIAASRLKATTAAVEADRLKQLATLAELKVSALGRELVQLQDARDSLRPGERQNFDRALRLVSESWGESRIPQTVIEVDMGNLDYVAWSARERATVEATFAMLDATFAQLQQYGQGGFRPEDAARLLNTIGIGAIAVGTN
jgi:hypothetical protein